LQQPPVSDDAGSRRALHVYSLGFLTQRRLRRILDLAGWNLRLGWPGAGGTVAVWGRRPVARRGEAVAARSGAGLLRVEDAFLRSVLPGRAGDPPVGLLLDRSGVHFDASAPSDLETLLASHPLDDPALIARARDGIAALHHWKLSKYNDVDPTIAPPAPGYVLVIDQTRGDASIGFGGASADSFAAMLAAARAENPQARIVIKAHPETALGHRPGHYGTDDCGADTELLTAPLAPQALLAGAASVYTVSSGMGFEAILSGHRPRLFGQPFYAGWGLSDDRNPPPRRGRRLTAEQLFAATMLLYPTWYDPHRDRLCSFEDAARALAADARARAEDRNGYVASGMRLWKRRHLQRFFGRGPGLRFDDRPDRASRAAAASKRPLLVWAGKRLPEHRADDLRNVEDGFLRSRGLGARLVAPLSLVSDAQGIYYDPGSPSDLEDLIAASVNLPEAELARARDLARRLVRDGLSKYNLGAAPPPKLPAGHRILVPGQVEDDASILRGCPTVRTNLDLLQHARHANPRAVIVYKPHPDVEAGLRKGALAPADLHHLADVVANASDPAALIAACDAIWTMTSLLGFEALMRDKPVTCLGMPFYAGWGLTRDHNAPPPRRRPGPTLDGLIHAALIGYPRYRDPVSGLPCPPEVIAERLATDTIPLPGPGNRLLSRLQGLLASQSALWR